MKRYGYIYEKIYSYENLELAIKCATRYKNKKKKNVRRLLDHKDYYIRKLQKMLYTGTYKLSENFTFTIRQKNGKEREITAPRLFPDQIIHWAVMNVLKPYFMKIMYPFNIGSIPKRGGIMGKKYIERVYKRDKKIRYILKLDIKKFYPSISHDKLKELLRTKFKDKRLLTLLDKIIDNGGKGLPIGYYTSQWLANFYLTSLDHYIKEKLQIKYYVRYVDDMVLIDTNKRKLHKAKRLLDSYLLDNKYIIHIKDNWQLWKIDSRPLDFLGYRFTRDRILLRKKIYYNIVSGVEKIRHKGYCTFHRALSLSSLLGWLKHIKLIGRTLYEYYIKRTIAKKELSSIVSINTKRISLAI